ncbi:MAG: relaxase domain-containing protein [Alphaproteobacteria bacterium]|nr:relaxase domain-containing protein [Alphaproteobacteria bacterium]
MVATLAQAASAAYYLESQRSFRHPNEYYIAGEEPDGVWFNPNGLLGLADGGRVDSADFHRLYNGFAPDSGAKLTRNAGSEHRSAGLDMTFSADKSVSALWAVAGPELRSVIERAHNDAARVALEETVLRYCAWTRIRNSEGEIEVLPADIAAAMFQHGTSRDNDPQLHTHCVIFNAARTHRDGKWRAMHQHPVYGWMKAAGAVYRNALAWNLRQRLGIAMEHYGRDGEFTRIAGLPDELTGHWSKRRKAIIGAAREMGFTVEGNAARAAAANKITRSGKSHDNDAEVRHRRWRDEAARFVEREALIASLSGRAEEITREQLRELTGVLEGLPERLTREEAVFRLPDIVEGVGNATAGLLDREAVAAAIERVARHGDVVRLTRAVRSAEGKAGMAHTRLYSTGRNLDMEQDVRDMAARLDADAGRGLPARAIEAKVSGLLDQGYPLSAEQIAAIRIVAGSGGQAAIIEGAAGSGKTTTLRPIADLYREQGKTIIATAVAWRTAVALGNDVDARPFCVDKLLRMAAREQIRIGGETVIIVDEAGMLSTRQAHHVLQLSERHGAKIVFAGDTAQQQPVEAGPGLRLIRDAVGSVRVDRIRRQKADVEDILVHVHGETPEAARLRAGSMGEEEAGRIIAAYEAMEEKPVFTPWQVAASEALRDGEAATAIAAWHARGRFHMGYDEEKTLSTLVGDWDRYGKRNPDKSSVVLARTRAEAAALSHLMRERRFPASGADEEARSRQSLRFVPEKRAIIHVSRGTEDDRASSPLEIAVGDRLRIGATHWEKQLFNGTVVTVEDIKVRRGGVANNPEGADPEGAGREAGGDGPDGPGLEGPPVLISARTDDGREVKFRHDEIRDWYGNIRLDHGYALTITSAQGLTVDRAFLLADARPARETIYPAATRHRDRLDIYVNRAPLALDIADSRADNDREVPVTDSEIRAYLAERWSRSRPKEAALDYMADGVWEGRRAETWEDRRAAAPEDGHHTAGARGRRWRRGTAKARPPANGNALARIARDIRRTAYRWRHGQAVAAFADGRREVLAAYGELRERTRAEGDAAALSTAFRDTLNRHGALLKQAEAFRARPAEFAPLLAENGGIGPKDLDAFEALHARASRHRRAATMRHVHRIKREAEQAPVQQPEPRVKAARTPKGGAVASEARKHGTGQAAPPETPEQRERRAQEEALEYSRLRAAVYGARTDEEARIAREELDAYVRRETEKHGTPEEKESEIRNRSRGLGRSL